MEGTPESPRGPEQKPPALVKPADSLREQLKKPDVPLPLGKLSEQKLDDYLQKIDKDAVLATYAELADRNVAAYAVQRIRQEKAGSSEKERADAGYRMAYYEKFPATLQAELRVLDLAMQKRSDYGLKNDPELDRLEKHATDYINALLPILRERVALGNYAFLRLPEHAPKKNWNARRAETEAELRNIGSVRRLTPQMNEGAAASFPLAINLQDLSDKNAAVKMRDAVAVADQNLSYVLSCAKDVPGVSPDHPGLSPLRVLYLTVLDHALEDNVQRGRRLQPSQKKEMEDIHAQRTRILHDSVTYLTATGSEDINGITRDMEHYSFRFQFENGSTKKPTDMPPAQLEKDMQRDAASRIAGFREHFGEMERDVLHAGWKDRVEQAWKKTAQPASFVLQEMVSVIRAVPRRAASALGKKMTEKLPGMVGDPLQQGIEALGGSTREEIMAPIRQELGLPKNFDIFNPEDWKKLTPEQKEGIRKKMDSTADVIDRHGEVIRKNMDTVNHDFSGLEQLAARYPADTLLNVQPDMDAFPEGKRVTVDDVAKADTKEKAVALYQCFFDQSQQDWKGYTDSVGMMLGDFEAVLKTNLNLKQQMRNAAEQMNKDFTVWLYLIGGALAAYLLRGQIFRAGVGTVKMGGRALGKVASTEPVKNFVRSERSSLTSSGNTTGSKTLAQELGSVAQGAAGAAAVLKGGELIENIQDEQRLTEFRDASKGKLRTEFLTKKEFKEEPKGSNVFVHKTSKITADLNRIDAMSAHTLQAAVEQKVLSGAAFASFSVAALSMRVAPRLAGGAGLAGLMVEASQADLQSKEARRFYEFFRDCPEDFFLYVGLKDVTGRDAQTLHDMVGQAEEDPKRQTLQGLRRARPKVQEKIVSIHNREQGRLIRSLVDVELQKRRADRSAPDVALTNAMEKASNADGPDLYKEYLRLGAQMPDTGDKEQKIISQIADSFVARKRKTKPEQGQ